MRHLINHLKNKTRGAHATTLVVGAGNGAELSLLRQLGGSRLIMVEADPVLATALARQIDTAHGEEVWSLAVTATSMEQATLHIVNNPYYSSLKSPTGLAEYFPNLQVVRQASVPALSLGDAIERLGLDRGTDHLLVVDAPGQGFGLLSTTSPLALQYFAHVIVRFAVEPLYADDTRPEALLAALRDIGFDVDSDDPEAIYPQGAVLLERNDVRVDRKKLEVRLDQLRVECETQTLLAEDLAQKVEELTQQCDAQAQLAARYVADIEKSTLKAIELEKLAADRQAQIGVLTQEHDVQERLVTQQRAELDKSIQAAAEQEKLMAERQALIGKLSRQNQERGARVIELEREHERLDRHQTWLNQEVIRAEAQVDLIKDILLRDQAQ